MKVLFFTGRNSKNRSGVSWKTWKIKQKGRTVTVWFGPVNVIERKVTPSGKLQSKTWTFRTEELAKENMNRRMAEKLRRGYELKPRWQ